MPTLDWLNRNQATQLSQLVPYRLLEHATDLSYGDANTENTLIQGDNLDALKALLPYYAGKVRCIYIDPPYNTQSAFAHYDDNLEHATWLTMMYPRLELLRELLAEDGSVWISIDDSEGHYLKVMCDEIFGRGSFVANVIWQKKYSPQPNAIWLSDSHDHILVFAKNKNIWRPFPLPRTEAMDRRYKNPDNDPRGVWKASDFTISLTGGQRGAQFAKTGESANIYEIKTPSGRKLLPAKGRCWGASPQRYKELVSENRIWFGKDGNNVPALKKFLTEVQDKNVAKTIWLREEAGDNQEAKQEIAIFNNEDVFATPKPERLLQRILELGTQPNDLVLDSFLGSGTTAAVAHKMGRRYIGIEMGEHAVTHCVPRLKKVVDGEQGGISEQVNWQGGGGFRFYRLGQAIYDEAGRINQNVRFTELAAHIWFTETHTPFTPSVIASRKAAKQSPTRESEIASAQRPRLAMTPLLGVHNGVAYYLLFNGILGDKRVNGGNVLTSRTLNALPAFDGAKVIYGETTRLGEERLVQANITFKQIPYDIKAR